MWPNQSRERSVFCGATRPLPGYTRELGSVTATAGSLRKNAALSGSDSLGCVRPLITRAF